MTEITSFSEANRVLAHFYTPQPTSYTLDTMRALMEFLGNPQERYRVIHVAGTSGKTSTAYYAAGLLSAAGYKTGLTVSPHVDEINERVQINMQPLRETDFCRALSEFLTLLETGDIKPSWFELMVAFAYWQFAREAVDYAVIEVGLGGLMDGTNVISRADKVCIITDIGYDHTKILGNTLSEIAAQKAGIIQPQNTVLMYDQGPEVMDAVRQRVAGQQTELRLTSDERPATLADLPGFQQRNFQLAEQAVRYSLQRDYQKQLSPEEINKGGRTYIPGRMEIIEHGDKTVILDGAHNGQKLAALKAALAEKYTNRPVAVLAAFVEGDEQRLDEALEVLGQISQQLILTSFVTAKDYLKHSVDPALVAERCRAKGLSAEVRTEPPAAFNDLLARPEPILLVTGSFYLLGHIRPLLG